MGLEAIFLVKKQRELDINFVYNSLKEKEQKGSLTRIERVLKNISRYPMNIVKHLKNFRKYLKKL